MPKHSLDRRLGTIEAIEEERITADVRRFAMGCARVTRALTLEEWLTVEAMYGREPTTPAEIAVTEKVRRLEQEQGIAELGDALVQMLGKVELLRRRNDLVVAAIHRIDTKAWRPGDEVLAGPTPADKLYEKMSLPDLQRLSEAPDGEFFPLIRELAIAYGELPALAD